MASLSNISIINIVLHLDDFRRSREARPSICAIGRLCACVVGGPARVGLGGSIAQHQGLRVCDKPTEQDS